jgi:hypothetical protein
MTASAYPVYIQTSKAPWDNAIIGGNFDQNPFQRGTTLTGINASSLFVADRWFTQYNSYSAVFTAKRTADAPTPAQAGMLVTNCLEIDCTTSGTANSNTYFILTQTVIARDCIGYGRTPLTLQFWAKSASNGTLCILIQDGIGGNCCVFQYSVTSAAGWTFYSFQIPPAITNNTTLTVNFILALGSTFYTTVLGSWQGSNKFGTSSQSNFGSSTSNVIKFANIKLETGPVATQFVNRPPGVELALCQRDFVKSFPQGVTPAQNLGTAYCQDWAKTLTATGVRPQLIIDLPVEMNSATPTLVSYNPFAANNQIRDITASADFASRGSVLSERQLVLTGTANASTVIGNQIGCDWTLSTGN